MVTSACLAQLRCSAYDRRFNSQHHIHKWITDARFPNGSLPGGSIWYADIPAETPTLEEGTKQNVRKKGNQSCRRAPSWSEGRKLKDCLYYILLAMTAGNTITRLQATIAKSCKEFRGGKAICRWGKLRRLFGLDVEEPSLLRAI